MLDFYNLECTETCPKSSFHALILTALRSRSEITMTQHKNTIPLRRFKVPHLIWQDDLPHLNAIEHAWP